MAEGQGRITKVDGTENMDNYPDSLNSSPRSRDTDPEYFGPGNRWDAVDSSGGGGGGSGGGRVRLMCSYGGKILPRPHDNQLTYVGGDTRILAVERNIRFGAIVAKLAGLWGTAVSFKYQLPDEDLDALISVTNEEDLEHMMAEYDRLLKSGYKFSRLRLFAFPTRQSEGGSGASSLASSVMEENGRREQWFLDALNAHPPVSQAPVSSARPEAATSAWVNNMPDYLFGLENSHNANNVGDENLKQKQGSENSDTRTTGGPENLTRVYDENNNRTGAVQEVTRPAVERVQNVNYQEANNNPRVQVSPPVQELQKMQLKQQQQPDPAPAPAPAPIQVQVPVPAAITRPVQEESQRKIYTERAPGSGPEVQRSAPEPAYQNAPQDYYAQDLQQQQQQQQHAAHGHFNPQSLAYWQMHDHAGAGVYLVPAGSAMMPSVRPPAGYYNPSVMPRMNMNLPQPVYEACPPVPTVRPMAMVQRQAPPEVADQYRDASAQPPPPQQQQQPVVAGGKMPAVYGMPPGGGPMAGMMYRASTPVQLAAGHQQDAYPYPQQHVMYEGNPPRQVYYTQALNPSYQPVGPVATDPHASPPEMTGSSPEQMKVGRV